MDWSAVDYCDVLIRLSFWRHPFTAEHPLLLWCFYQTLILTAPIHCRASIAIVMCLSDSHSDGTHSLQSIHCYCDVFIRLSFWRHHSLQSIHCYCDVFIRLSFWRHPFTAEHPLLLWCVYQTLILTAPIHCRASIAIVMFLSDSHSDGTHSLQSIHCYCDVFIRLSFWRHPFTAEHPLLLWCFYQTLILTAPHSLQSIHCYCDFYQTLILTAPIHCRASIAIVMFLSDSHSDGTHSLQSIHCYCDVFIRLSFWRHPFIAETLMQRHISTNLMKKQTH